MLRLVIVLLLIIIIDFYSAYLKKNIAAKVKNKNKRVDKLSDSSQLAIY